MVVRPRYSAEDDYINPLLLAGYANRSGLILISTRITHRLIASRDHHANFGQLSKIFSRPPFDNTLDFRRFFPDKSTETFDLLRTNGKIHRSIRSIPSYSSNSRRWTRKGASTCLSERNTIRIRYGRRISFFHSTGSRRGIPWKDALGGTWRAGELKGRWLV